MAFKKTLRVAILEDHQSIVDGYRFRLSGSDIVEIVGVATYGEDLEPLLVAHPADVLLLDVNVPTSATNRNPYPIFNLVPRLHQVYPNLAIVVISMHAESSLIKAMMRAGASGYILKEDRETIERLAEVVRAAAHGDICLSPQARQLWLRRSTDALEPVTQRQRDVLSLCAAYPDLSTAELAARLSVAPSTLRNLLSGAYMRLGVSSRAGAVAEARRRGLITPPDKSAPRAAD
jgi:DNA-binding NarL/FixJ family response regulator